MFCADILEPSSCLVACAFIDDIKDWLACVAFTPDKYVRIKRKCPYIVHNWSISVVKSTCDLALCPEFLEGGHCLLDYSCSLGDSRRGGVMFCYSRVGTINKEYRN